MNTQKRTKLHIEFIRILAIFFVFFNHTNQAGYTLYFSVDKAALKSLYLTLSNLCVIAVPLFFMISGALLLSKEESYVDLYVKRVLRIILALLLSTAAYRVYYHFAWNSDWNFFSTIVYLPFGWGYFSQWYLYSYLAFLVMLPLLRKMVKSMSSRDFIYVFLANLLIGGVIPMLVFFLSKGQLSIISYFEPTLVLTESIVYALMGYYLEKVVKRSAYENILNVVLCLVAGISALFVTGLFVNYKLSILTTLDGNWLSDTQKMIAIVPTVSVYFIAKYLFDGHEFRDSTKRIVASLGSCVFGIFLIEGILREITLPIYQVLVTKCGLLTSCLIWIISALVIGFLVIEIVKRIPGINKIL